MAHKQEIVGFQTREGSDASHTSGRLMDERRASGGAAAGARPALGLIEQETIGGRVLRKKTARELMLIGCFYRLNYWWV